MTALAAIDAPGLVAYLDEVEERLEAAVAAHPGGAATAGAEALVGGKRLRPLLVFLAAPPGEAPSVAAGVAVELVHVATLVHDDAIDQAHLRHGRPSIWSMHGRDVAAAAGDYLFARAFAELAASGDVWAVRTLAAAAVSLSRGEALQRRQAHDPATTVESYLERCALKTGKLFEAACLLGGRRRELAAFGLALGIAYQIVDDILDCGGDPAETGKLPGTDLREGTPTLPLILASQQDEVVRRALAGGRVDGALGRVRATGALERSRETALAYARRANEALGDLRTQGLDALTRLAIERRG